MHNIPKVKMGIVAVSRGCFPLELSRSRLQRVLAACRQSKIKVIACKTIVRTDAEALKAAQEMIAEGVNAATIYLGNFGPEAPIAILAERLGMPCMLCGAAEESKADLLGGRGDAYCGMLNASLNCGLRQVRPYIPAQPVRLPEEIVPLIKDFMTIARVIIGVRALKIFSFGPRPEDFYACHAPLAPLYRLGVEGMENSELDLLQRYQAAGSRRQEIAAIAQDMADELGPGNCFPRKLKALAQFELALLSFLKDNLGARSFGVFANKCWPAFQPAFGFVPCYVNSRLARRGIPVACEVDIYGALSEYLAQLAVQQPVTLLDINNTVPQDIEITDFRGASRADIFMGFHCGNTPSCHLLPGYKMHYQLIMRRNLEPDSAPNISCGTLEGRLVPGPLTLLRVQSTLDGELHGYLAEGQILDVDPVSFGGIGIIAIPQFNRFYRHILLEKQFPHHTACAFEHSGRMLFEALSLLKIDPIHTPRQAGDRYPTENPFAD
ncbi:MAG: fucose isomerase [Lentisphaerae bacterium]|nr:fucose isomerase [Lentisphaerota bacterium]